MAKWQTGDDWSGSSFLDQPGTYHLAITAVDEAPAKRDGSLIDNAFFRMSVAVLAGTVPDQQDKTTDLTFFWPKPSDRDGGKFRTKQIDRCFSAAGLVTEDQKGKEVDIDLQLMVGRQVVAKLDKSQDDKYLQLSFADIYHVDDPAIKGIPKNAEALKLIPASQRRVSANGAAATANADASQGKRRGRPPKSEAAMPSAETTSPTPLDLDSIDL
jgi:hypothetical protein